MFFNNTELCLYMEINSLECCKATTYPVSSVQEAKTTTPSAMDLTGSFSPETISTPKWLLDGSKLPVTTPLSGGKKDASENELLAMLTKLVSSNGLVSNS